MNIKYTVIIPHFNMPDLLKRLILSIPERKDIQIVVVDDCSPNADIYLERYDFLHRINLQFIISDRNGGGGHARNIGLKHALGQWVIFADSDDFFTTNAFDVFDKHCDTTSDVVYYNIKSVMSSDITKDAKRSAPKDRLFEQYNKTHNKDIFRYHHPEPWGKMAKRRFIEENHIVFDETKVANDYFYSIQIGTLAKDVDIVNEKIYVLTLREGSVSHDYANNMEKLIIRINVYAKVQLFLEEHNVYIRPVPTRGIMVTLLQTDKIKFMTTLGLLYKKGINIYKLLVDMFNPKYMNKWS